MRLAVAGEMARGQGAGGHPARTKSVCAAFRRVTDDARSRRISWAPLGLLGRSLAALVMLATLSSGLSSSALASRLHELAASTMAFSSDGTRYAAWQVREGGPIVVLDTLTGHRVSLTATPGCVLADQAGGNSEQEPIAGAGRFLLNCYEQNHTERAGLLDVRTGMSTLLPNGPTGFNWHRVGARYAEGWAADDTCQRTKPTKGPGEVCIGLYDLATGAVTDRAGWEVPDLSRLDAPPVCRALRHGVIVDQQSASPMLFSYADGFFVHAGARPGETRIDRCRGHPIVLHGRGKPLNFDVRGGLLTWDTGHNATFNTLEEDTSHGSLMSYQLSNGKRRSWTLPNLSLKRGETGSGVFGYSTHTASTVFWIASRAVGCEKVACVETSSVYAASLK